MTRNTAWMSGEKLLLTCAFLRNYNNGGSWYILMVGLSLALLC